jgi:hypothetical protein
MTTGDYVLVTTDKRGVFAGRLVKDSGRTVTLADGRNCIYWSTECKGFLGLAAHGPIGDSRIGPPAPELVLHGVTAVALCTDEARAVWER